MLKNILVKTFATVFGLGFMPVGPGTWGTLGGAVFWYYFMDVPVLQYAAVSLVVLIISVWASWYSEEIFGEKDSGNIVIDEFIGYLVTMLLAPHTITAGIIGFVLFRIFDILKPVPIGLMERLPKGIGIVADDVMAGIYAAIVLNVIMYFI
jgi:phosphatidylglycerophosphatase A